MTGLSAPGWPQLSSTHFHVAVEGKPMYIVVRPHTAGCHNLLETQKDAGPHAKELGPRPALPFLVTEPIPFTRLGFPVYKMGRNCAPSTSQLVGRPQEQMIGLDWVPLLNCIYIYCS